MWILILSLYFIQQESGTKVEVQHTRIDKIGSEAACNRGGKAWVAAHTDVATEPWSDENGKEGSRFALVRPVYVCLPTGDED